MELTPRSKLVTQLAVVDRLEHVVVLLLICCDYILPERSKSSFMMMITSAYLFLHKASALPVVLDLSLPLLQLLYSLAAPRRFQ